MYTSHRPRPCRKGLRACLLSVCWLNVVECVLLMAAIACWPARHDPFPSIKALHYPLEQNMNHKWHIDWKNHKLLYIKKKNQFLWSKTSSKRKKAVIHLKGSMQFKDLTVIQKIGSCGVSFYGSFIFKILQLLVLEIYHYFLDTFGEIYILY